MSTIAGSPPISQETGRPLSIAEAARALGVSASTVGRLIQSGQLPVSRAGRGQKRGRVLINRQAVERLRPQDTPPPSALEQVQALLPALSRRDLAEVSSAIAQRWQEFV